MAEYIKRDDAIGIVEEIRDDRESRRYSNPFTMIIDSIEGIPAADVVERKIGKWERQYICQPFRCSNCGHEAKRKWNYCPDCGARMEG